MFNGLKFKWFSCEGKSNFHPNSLCATTSVIKSVLEEIGHQFYDPGCKKLKRTSRSPSKRKNHLKEPFGSNVRITETGKRFQFKTFSSVSNILLGKRKCHKVFTCSAMPSSCIPTARIGKCCQELSKMIPQTLTSFFLTRGFQIKILSLNQK